MHVRGARSSEDGWCLHAAVWRDVFEQCNIRMSSVLFTDRGHINNLSESYRCRCSFKRPGPPLGYRPLLAAEGRITFEVSLFWLHWVKLKTDSPATRQCIRLAPGSDAVCLSYRHHLAHRYKLLGHCAKKLKHTSFPRRRRVWNSRAVLFKPDH